MTRDRKGKEQKTRIEMKKIWVILIVALLCGVAEIVYAQTWQETLENAGFDVVETFDELQDWTPQTCADCKTINLPKKTDGTDSRWGRYCMWEEPTPGNPSIGNHGTDKQVGTKSFSVLPPTYMTMYFGDGTPESGYSDFYIFFRIYLPRNLFPTRIIETHPENNTVLVDYVEGEPYIWWDSFKFINLNTGFTSANGWNYLDPVPDVYRYGDTEIWYGLFRNSQTNGIFPRLQMFYSKRNVDSKPKVKLDALISMEFHFKLEEPAGYGTGYTGNGVAEVWLYDENGNGELTLQATNMSFRPETGEGHLFNRIQIAGNRHIAGKYWLYGPNMVDEFYLDDFIIDNERIGPRYYALLNNQQARLEDINADGVVNVLDVQLCVNVILEFETREEFVNKIKVLTAPEAECTVSDLQRIVNVILGV